jgi:hypothetical protein
MTILYQLNRFYSNKKYWYSEPVKYPKKYNPNLRIISEYYELIKILNTKL